GLTALGTTFDHFAFAAFRAFDADGLLFDELTCRIVTAGGELAEPAGLLYQVVSALGALLIQLEIGFLLRRADLPGGFAIRIGRAGVKRSKAPLLEDHRAIAILAEFLFPLLSQIGIIQIRQVDRQLASVGAEVVFSLPREGGTR